MNNPYRLPALLSFPLAVLLAVCSLGGILLPAVYAREHPYWAAQGRGQDWVDLAFVVPSLAACAWRTLGGSRVARLLLAGTLAYALYSLVLYAFFMHFGPLFLVYAWAFGLAFYALVAIVFALASDEVGTWFGAGAPFGVAGVFAVICGASFYVLWLSEVVPASLSGGMLKSASDSGLITNPVEVLDLGVVLPAFIIGGIAILRRRRIGYWLAPMMLAFGVVMDVALGGMAIAMSQQQTGAGGPPPGVFVVMTLVTAAVLAMLLRRVQKTRPDARPVRA